MYRLLYVGRTDISSIVSGNTGWGRSRYYIDRICDISTKGGRGKVRGIRNRHSCMRRRIDRKVAICFLLVKGFF